MLAWYRNQRTMRLVRRKLLEGLTEYIAATSTSASLEIDHRNAHTTEYWHPSELPKDTWYTREIFFKRADRQIKAILRELKKSGQLSFNEAKTRFDVFLATCKRVEVRRYIHREDYSPSNNHNYTSYYSVYMDSTPYIPASFDKFKATLTPRPTPAEHL